MTRKTLTTTLETLQNELLHSRNETKTVNSALSKLKKKLADTEAERDAAVAKAATLESQRTETNTHLQQQNADLQAKLNTAHQKNESLIHYEDTLSGIIDERHLDAQIYRRAAVGFLTDYSDLSISHGYLQAELRDAQEKLNETEKETGTPRKTD